MRDKGGWASIPRLANLTLATAAGIAALVTAALTTNVQGLPIDDAYIHLTFARNLNQLQSLCFNPGEFSLGFSSPLWLATLAITSAIAPTDPVKIAKALSIGAFALSTFTLYYLVRASVDKVFRRIAPPIKPNADDQTQKHDPARWNRRAYAIAAGLGLAVCGNMSWLAGSGMEATLFLLLGLITIIWIHSDQPRPIAGGIALGLLILARPTGMALLLILAVPGLAAPAKRKRLFGALIIAGLIALPWTAFVFAATGGPLPPTRAGKLASNLFNSGPAPTGIKTFVSRHLDYFYIVNTGVALLIFMGVVAAAALLALHLRNRKNQTAPEQRDPRPTRAQRVASLVTSLSPAEVLVLWALAHFALHALLFRSTQSLTPYHNLRYQVMLIPAAIAGAATALAALAAWLGRGNSNQDNAGLPLGYIVLLCAFVAPLVIEAIRLPQWRGLYESNVEHLQTTHRPAAEWANRQTPTNARIASLDVGMLGYYSRRYVIDLGGLIDPDIIPQLARQRVGPYMTAKGATHYFHLIRHDSDRITGVTKDLGKLYNLESIGRYDYPPYVNFSQFHSLGIVLYDVEPLSDGSP